MRPLPAMAGKPIRLELCRSLRDAWGEVHAGAFLRERRICLEADLTADRAAFERILVHELHHFVWLRLGNPRRRAWEELLGAELEAHARGELGWSAEWRKRALRPEDPAGRTRRWREYACESFCDTAGWLYCGAERHPEFTLAARYRERRRRWFADSLVTEGISV